MGRPTELLGWWRKIPRIRERRKTHRKKRRIIHSLTSQLKKPIWWRRGIL